ncbi:papilin-like isoform X2 [Haemaphysalis longicornis]
MKTIVFLAILGAALAADFETYCRPVKDPGHCKGYFPRWWFNVKSGQCEQFVYGGCQGNKNNYETMQQCEQTCLRARSDVETSAQSSDEVSATYRQMRRRVNVRVGPICTLEADPGPCFGYFPRYYFNYTLMTCQKFIYGGCQGNKNNFETVEECEQRCKNSTGVLPHEDEIVATEFKAPADFEIYCKPEKETGPCKASIPRWWFNVKTGQCEQFIYGGCQGNKNNYATKRQCDLTCLRTRTATTTAAIREGSLSVANVHENVACVPKPDPGMCAGYFPRYYFDMETRTCKQFIYGGCQGNPNNFESAEECEASCAPVNDYQRQCLSRPETGPCRAHMRMWAFDIKEGQCVEFVYGGCDGTDNKYRTKEECEKNCNRPQNSILLLDRENAGLGLRVPSPPRQLNPVCYLPKVVGRCLAYMPRYYYNTTTKTCQKFIYGGCEGNANNFFTLRECNQTCPRDFEVTAIAEPELASSTSQLNPVCYLPKVVGRCLAYMPRYYYNTTTRTCQKFIYGGCEGNANNFLSRYECNQTCSGDVEVTAIAEPELATSTSQLNPVCYLPKVVGRCLAYMPRYYYNTTTRTCQKFIYGGCEGNANNFLSRYECNQTCSGDVEVTAIAEPELATSTSQLNPVCYLPKVVGRCLAYFPRYYYNTTTRTCEKFIYGGCEGNANNFLTPYECNRTCSGDLVSAIAEPALTTSPVHENFACLGNPDPGMCAGYFPRYYFDKVSRTCKQFVYGGCGGNRNNYHTVQECMASCAPTTDYERKCLARAETGPCRARMMLWAYDSTEGQCKQFTYGGCDGNDNKYPTKEDCESTCLHPLGDDVDGIIAPPERGAQYKDVNGVYWETPSLALQSTPSFTCSLPMFMGPCKARLPRFYFDADENKCKPFVYGGCDGNDNNFETMEDCKASCAPTSEYERQCLAKPDRGPCLAYMPMFFFNATTSMCETFIYGGCDGNDNKYRSMQECFSTCFNNTDSVYLKDRTISAVRGPSRTSLEVRKNPICYLPKEKGPCYAYFPRFYYNSNTERCEEFIYGGCRGNANNFNTVEECKNTCKNTTMVETLEDVEAFRYPLIQMTTSSVCTLEKDVGPCKASIPRYYYNPESGTCALFLYGGCHGNGNNFPTPELCLKKCRNQNTVLPRA